MSGFGRFHWRDPGVLTALAFVGFGLVYVMVNATTLIDQRHALGQPIQAWRAWLLEFTSFLAWLLILPGIIWLASRLSSLRNPPVLLANHVLACVACSLAHTLLIMGLRFASFAFVGEAYTPAGTWHGILTFEFRKDIITYSSVVLVYLMVRRLAAPPAQNTVALTMPTAQIEVRDGSKTLWLKPDEIDWISAAGNYVELHGAFGALLTRRTLGEMESELAQHGFVRVHRSRIVRRASIVSTETRQSGDFYLILGNGDRICGSRRFRANVQQGSEAARSPAEAVPTTEKAPG